MPEPDVVYRYAGGARRRPPFAGVPMRDLTARDVARLDAATIRNITGGAKPLYAPVQTTAAREARAEAGAPEPPKPAKAEKE
jgi:hypothetical protein